MKKQTKADFLLVIVTFFWGSSYILTKFGLRELSPFNLSAMRFVIGFIASAIVLYPRLKDTDLKTLKYAGVLGLLMTMIFTCQTFGLLYTTASNAGFLVSLAMIMVPALSILFLKEQPNSSTLLGVVLAFIGVILLTGIGSIEFNVGDGLFILCALLCAFHILLMGRLTKMVDSIALGVWQLGFVGLFNTILTLVLEKPILPQLSSTWTSILFLAVFCTAFGLIAQCYAQQYTNPTHTALIFSLESVFSAILAFIFLKERLSPRGWIGAVLLLIGTLASQLKVLSFLHGRSDTNKTLDPSTIDIEEQ